MSQYRRVLIITISVTVLLALAVPLLRDTEAADFLSYAILVLAVSNIVATSYIGSLVVRDKRKPRSWLLLMLFTTASLVTIAFLLIGGVVARRFLGLPPLPPGEGLLVTGMAVLLLGVVPIMKAVLFALVRHNSPDAPDSTVEALQ